MMVELEEQLNAHDDAMHAVRARLHAFITRKVKTPEAAEDLIQEVLLRPLQHNHGQIANPTAWLYQVARNVIIDHYCTRHSGHRLALDEQAQRSGRRHQRLPAHHGLRAKPFRSSERCTPTGLRRPHGDD